MQSYHKLWYHFIWATKNRERLITAPLKDPLAAHFNKYGESKGFYVDSVNGDMDHVHLLVRVKPTKAPADVANLFKGESSNWINKNNFIRGKFAWQNGYAVFSVSESQLPVIRKYIKNQEEHHRRKSFTEEWDGFMIKHGLETP